MSEHPQDELTFEHWVQWVFDRPVSTPEWYQVENNELWVSSPAVKIAFITRLFTTAPRFLQKYSDTQANQGLWFLASSIFSDELSHLYGDGILESDRHRCIDSIYILFKDYFAIHCQGEDVKTEETSLNITCFMWWDFFRHFAEDVDGRIHSELDSEILATMGKILKLNNIVCKRSALHGLGHWQAFCPNEVAVIIDGFISDNPELDQELHAYALAARAGSVL